VQELKTYLAIFFYSQTIVRLILHYHLNTFYMCISFDAYVKKKFSHAVYM